jgi:membrane-associated protein
LVFAETGLMLGLVIPGGETLIFATGLLISTNVLRLPVAAVLPVLVACAIAGDISGYLIGKKLGPQLKDKPDTWYFKKKYVHIAEDFVKKYKKRSLVLGKFLPVVRPFMPLISGVSHMSFTFFLILTVLSACLYIGSFLLLGYFLGSRFPAIEQYLGWIIPISIVVALIPVVRHLRKFKNDQHQDA